MKKATFILFFTLLTQSCSNADLYDFHEILGSERGWYNTPDLNIRVLQDIKVNELRVRHVRMNESNCVSGYKDHMELQGPIGPDSTEIVKRLFNDFSKCYNSRGTYLVPNVYLSSCGGRLVDGFSMGNQFRQISANTYVNGEAICASSCAIAFLGGSFRGMSDESKLLFHTPFVVKNQSLPQYFGNSTIDCLDMSETKELKEYYF